MSKPCFVHLTLEQGERCQPDDLRASSFTRAWGQFTVNGNADELVGLDAGRGYHSMCTACFVAGTDVVVPLPVDDGAGRCKLTLSNPR